MIDWTDATLGDVLTFQRGFDITRKVQNKGRVPVVSSGGISSHHDSAAAKGPGVVIGRKGTLGKVFYLEEDYWPHDTTLWVKDFKGSLPRFVYYFMKQVDVSSLDVGSANPTLNRNHLHPLRIRWPNRSIQRAIAEVLGALDDKIAANTKLAHTADELLSDLFLRASQGGPSTDLAYEQVGRVGGGGTPRTKVPEYWNGDVNWATPTDITALTGPYLERSSRKISEEGLANCASPLYPAGSILMTSRATIGAFAIAEAPTAVNQGFIVVVVNDPDLKWWIFHEMRSKAAEFTAHANGATFLELNRRTFKKLRVRLGETHIMKEFNETADALHARARAALLESDTLAELRDTLLPPLMSGRLRVKDAEDAVGDVI